MELKNAEIIKIGELRTLKNDFKIIEFVVKTDEADYPQLLSLQSKGDKAENVLKYNKVGQRVDVSVNLRGREWINPEGVVKYFNTIEAWKVMKAGSDFKPEEVLVEEDGDLPF
jgi:translation initiation factor IF-3